MGAESLMGLAMVEKRELRSVVVVAAAAAGRSAVRAVRTIACLQDWQIMIAIVFWQSLSFLEALVLRAECVAGPTVVG